mmetsp:Transcript_12669/g.21119  ORF Transcript_12669/g.21119 Transcript_12669/m.21119 type:complete len:88 (+) Transcript_12669:20-283(+)
MIRFDDCSSFQLNNPTARTDTTPNSIKTTGQLNYLTNIAMASPPPPKKVRTVKSEAVVAAVSGGGSGGIHLFHARGHRSCCHVYQHK